MTQNEFGKLALIGAGKMGGAMLDGWIEKGNAARIIEVIDPDPSDHLLDMEKAGRVGVSPVMGDEGVGPGDIVVLAVKPQKMDEVLTPIARVARPGVLIISIAAGVSLQTLQDAFGPGTPVIRAMPNLPASIGFGMTVVAANEHVSDHQKGLATRLLAATGKVAWIENESQMDAVTALSGSGPAYVFLMIEAMAKAGIAEGLSEELSMALAIETVRGAGNLAAISIVAPSTLRKNVTSPAGTTEAALGVLMQDGRFDRLIGDAIAAAAARSKALGG